MLCGNTRGNVNLRTKFLVDACTFDYISLVVFVRDGECHVVLVVWRSSFNEINGMRNIPKICVIVTKRSCSNANPCTYTQHTLTHIYIYTYTNTSSLYETKEGKHSYHHMNLCSDYLYQRATQYRFAFVGVRIDYW